MLERLEKLRKALVLGWSELAERLEISRAMLDFVKTGKRNASPKLLRRIEQAEREAGIATETPLDRACEGSARDGALHLSPAAYAATTPAAARLIAEATPEMQKMADLFSAFARIESKLDSITSRLDKIEKGHIK